MGDGCTSYLRDLATLWEVPRSVRDDKAVRAMVFSYQ
jgi:hypothetical protein